MRRVTAFAVVLWLAAMPVHAEEKGPCCIDELMAEWAAALDAGDVEKAVSFYDGTGEALAVESSGTLRQGMEGIKAMYEEAFAEVDFSDVRVNPMKVHLAEGMGYAYLELRTGGTLKADNTPIELHVQGTWTLRKVDGGWKILVEHFSPLKDVPRVKILKKAR